MAKVYLLHFSRPYKGVRHYMGAAADLGARLKRHKSGDGSALLRAVRAAGITWVTARTWARGGFKKERALKRRCDHASLCPRCSGPAAWRRG